MNHIKHEFHEVLEILQENEDFFRANLKENILAFWFSRLTLSQDEFILKTTRRLLFEHFSVESEVSLELSIDDIKELWEINEGETF